MAKELTVVNEVKSSLEKMKKQFQPLLPENVTVEKFVRVCQTSVQTNPKLLSSDRKSLYAACMRAAEAGLLPDGKNAALVSYGPKVEFIPMIAGIKSKIRESGLIKKWQLQVVYENDEFDWEEGDNDHIYHKPLLTDRGNPIAAYSIVTYQDGTKDHCVMNMDQINKRKQKARTKNIWDEWPEEMYKKTVGKYHAKDLPLDEGSMNAIDSMDDVVEAEFKEHKSKEEEKPKKKETSNKLADAVEQTQEQQQQEVPI